MEIFLKKQWDRKSSLVIMDEIHKWRKWKVLLKGVYDTEGIPPRILVTGSARLDIYRRGGDSLAGRYFLHRLHPFSVAELKEKMNPSQALENLLVLGGFPEPFLSQSETKAKRWRKLYIERIIREDVFDIAIVSDIQALLLMVEMLRERVGSPVSYASIARDLQLSPHTVKKWVEILESMYIIFRVTPYHKNIARAILKEPKIYFYDTGLVRGDKGKVFENLVAGSLLKYLHFMEDTEGAETRLHYVRDKEKREVDFLLIIDGKISNLIEAKFSDENLSRNLYYYHNRFPETPSVQIVYSLNKPKTISSVQIESAADWLSKLPV
jgi:predicted AAA+ superfamily ATPase